MAEFKNMAEKFEAVIAILEGKESAMAREEAIAFLEDRAEKAKSKPRARKANPEVEEFRASVATFLSEQDGPVTAKVVAEALGVSSQKASAALRALAAANAATAIAGEKAKDAKTYVIA